MVQGITVQSQCRDPRLRVTMSQAATKVRKLYSMCEMSPNIDLCINNGDIETLSCALLERMYMCKVGGVFVPPPKVDRVRFYTGMVAFHRKLIVQLDSMRWDAPSSLDEVVSMYVGRKRTIYQQARDSLAELEVSRKDAISDAFVKVEKVVRGKAPRCIQPRKARYNLALGRFIKKAEHKIFRAIARVFRWKGGRGKTIMKGMNLNGVARCLTAKWNEFRNPVAVELDATKFDMHVSVAALQWEHDVYLHLYPRHQRELARLLKWQVNNIGRGFCDNGTLRYKVDGRRFSGDMNTGLGNCLLMSGMIYSYADSRGVTIQLANNGDDCTVFMEREDLNQFLCGLDEWFLEMGFRMTTSEPKYALEHIEFCQMHPILVNGEPTMVRNIPVALRKDTLTTIDITDPNTRRAWAKAIGDGGMAGYGGVPVLQNFYRCLQRIGAGKRNRLANDPCMQTGMSFLVKGMDKHFAVPDATTREQVFSAWDISPDEQKDMERYYDNYQCGGELTCGVVDTHVNQLPIFAF